MSQALGRHAAKPALEQFLTQLLDPQRPLVDARSVAVIVAHPDDETIGCGGQLPRWRGVSVVVVTDGSPQTVSANIIQGFGSSEKYSAARANELLKALSIADVSPRNLERLLLRDQRAAFRLSELTSRLVEVFYRRGTQIAITHAYEGGHPDHDAAAFAVHSAQKQMERRGQPLSILEMPFYRAANGSWLLQNFAQSPGHKSIVLQLTDKEQAQKRQMLAAHVSQREMLAHFSTKAEYFRVAPNYDFAKPPNGGQVFYEQHDWGMKAPQWCELARNALAELDSGALV